LCSLLKSYALKLVLLSLLIYYTGCKMSCQLSVIQVRRVNYFIVVDRIKSILTNVRRQFSDSFFKAGKRGRNDGGEQHVFRKKSNCGRSLIRWFVKFYRRSFAWFSALFFDRNLRHPRKW
jgi:hypothetical protein